MFPKINPNETSTTAVTTPAAVPVPGNLQQVIPNYSATGPSSPTSDLILIDGMTMPCCNRVIVIVPSDDVDELRLGRKIWSLVPRLPGMEVILVGLISRDDYQPRLQRTLVGLAAVVSDTFYSISTLTIKSHNWVTALKGVIQPGDLIITPKGLEHRSSATETIPLANALAAKLQIPVYVISGFTPEIAPQPHRNIFVDILLWALLAGIIGGFFIFENNISLESTGWIRIVFSLLALVIEVFLIWGWNVIKG